MLVSSVSHVNRVNQCLHSSKVCVNMVNIYYHIQAGIFVNLDADVPLAHKPITPQVLPSSRQVYLSHKISLRTSRQQIHLQRLQALDSSLTCYGTSHEWQYRRSSLPKSRNPADAAGEQPAWENASRLVHDDWIYRTQKDTNKRDSNRSSYKRRNEPDNKLETRVERISQGNGHSGRANQIARTA